MRSIWRVCALAAGLSSPIAQAGVNEWSSVGPEGVRALDIVRHLTRTDLLFLIGESGLYSSSDNGASWRLIKGDWLNSPSDVDIDPTNPDRLVVVASDRESMWISNDAGASISPATSSPVNAPGTANIFQTAFGADGTMYATVGASVFVSDDRGSSWNECTSPLPSGVLISELEVDPANSDVVYAYGGTSADPHVSLFGLFVSVDRGGSWRQIAALDGATSWLTDIALIPGAAGIIVIARGDGLHISDNYGASWRTLVSEYVQAIGVDPANPDRWVVAGSPGRFLSSSDAGGHWVELASPANDVRAIAIDPLNSQRIIVVGLGGVFVSTDGGARWSRSNLGMDGTSIMQITTDEVSRQLIVNTVGQGVFAVDTATLASTELSIDAFRSSSNHLPLVTAAVAQAGATGHIHAAANTGLYRSLDSGQSWERIDSAELWVRNFASSRADTRALLAFSPDEILRSEDSGVHWAPLATALPEDSFATAIAFSPSDPNIVYLASYSAPPGQASPGLYRSTDAGRTFSAVTAPSETYAITQLAVHPLGSQTAYAVALDGLFKTTDSGATWSRLSWDSGVSPPGFSHVTIDPNYPEIIYATSTNRLGRSVSGGNTWEWLYISSTGPIWFPSALALDPVRSNEVFLGTERHGVQHLSIQPDLTIALSATSGSSASTWTVQVRNEGSYHATGVTTTVELPGDAQGGSAGMSNGTCSVVGPVVTCKTDLLPSSNTAEITVSASIPAMSTGLIRASVTSQQPDPVSSNNEATLPAIVSSPPDVSAPVSGGGGGSLSGEWLLLLLATRVIGASLPPQRSRSFRRRRAVRNRNSRRPK